MLPWIFNYSLRLSEGWASLKSWARRAAGTSAGTLTLGCREASQKNLDVARDRMYGMGAASRAKKFSSELLKLVDAELTKQDRRHDD
jgi:hypothetical protein